MASVRAVPTWQQSGTPSTSAERARRGPSALPSSIRAAEPLPDVLGSAREVIERLEAAVAGEWAQLEADRAALIDERERLAEVGHLLEACIAAARAAHERERHAMDAEWETLDEVREEAVAAQEEATRLGETSWQRAVELLARERLVQAREDAIVPRENAVEASQADLAHRKDELERSHAEVYRREEEVTIHETDVGITATALDAREEQLTRREAEAASASAALTAREEQAAKWESELTAQE